MRIRGLPTMYCPCVDCLNQKKFAQWDNIFDHLITRGFKNKYTCWNRHGEEGLNEGEAECLNEGEALRHARGLNEGERNTMMMKPLMKVNSFISHCYRVKQNVLPH